MTMSDNDFEQIWAAEEAYLQTISSHIPQRISKLREKLTVLSRDNSLQAKSNKGLYKIEIDNLLSLDSEPPYFARCDVAWESAPGKFYIGIVSVGQDECTDYLVYSWTTPFGHLCYQCRKLGKAQYTTHDGRQEVEFFNKRQFTIQNNRLVAISDVNGNYLSVHETYASLIDSDSERIFVETHPEFSDALLSDRLSRRNASGQMRHFVETIQAEQSEVIWAQPDDSILVVQGPAGSGKTGCALKRVAVVLANKRRRRKDLFERTRREMPEITGDEMIIFSPNPIFSGYVSQVLVGLREQAIRRVELDEFLRATLARRIRQTTPLPQTTSENDADKTEDEVDEFSDATTENFAADDSNFKSITNKPKYFHRVERRWTRYEERIEAEFNEAATTHITRFKSRRTLLTSLELFVHHLSERFVQEALQNDIEAARFIPTLTGEGRDGVFVTAEELQGMFERRRRKGESLAVAVTHVIGEIDQRRTVYQQSDAPPVSRRAKKGGPQFRDLTRRDWVAVQQVNAAVSQWQADVQAATLRIFAIPLILLYSEFWRWLDTLSEEDQTAADLTQEIGAATLRMLNNMAVPFEDTMPLLLLDGFIHGFDERAQGFAWAQHAIIDEGQDYTPLHYEYLRRILPHSCGLTIVGDIDQSIEEGAGLSAWEDLKEVFEDRFLRKDLTQSFRSCQEITDFASLIRNDGQVISNHFSEGRKPLLIELPDKADESDVVDAIAEEASRLITIGNQSVGIICRTQKECQRLMRRLPSRLQGGITARLLQEDGSLESGVTVLPLRLAKGLEFDAALIPDASVTRYPSDKDRRALYTACTRALHDLSLIHMGCPTPLLSSIIRDNASDRRTIPLEKLAREKEKPSNNMASKTDISTPLTPVTIEDLVAPWQALPKDAPHWSLLQDYFDRLIKLHDQKTREFERIQEVNALREKVAEAQMQLGALCQSVGEDLGFNLLEWNPNGFDEAVLGIVASHTDVLFNAVSEYAENSGLLPEVSAAERSNVFRRQAELLDEMRRVRGLIGELH